MDKFAISPDWQTFRLNTVPELPQNEVHIYCLSLELDAQTSADAVTWLNDIQRDKYARRAQPYQQAAYLAGRYYLLSLLGAYTGVAPNEVLLSYSRLNKPSLSDTKLGIQFNFTDTDFTRQAGHKHTVGLFAFCHGRQLGVDIEALSRRSNYQLIADKRFTAAEQAWVTLADGRVDRARFLHIWTRKEASGKATGQGINFKMNQRELVQGDDAIINYVDENQQPWRLTQLQIYKSDANLVACLVHEGHQPLTLRAFTNLK